MGQVEQEGCFIVQLGRLSSAPPTAALPHNCGARGSSRQPRDKSGSRGPQELPYLYQARRATRTTILKNTCVSTLSIYYKPVKYYFPLSTDWQNTTLCEQPNRPKDLTVRDPCDEAPESLTRTVNRYRNQKSRVASGTRSRQCASAVSCAPGFETPPLRPL